MWSLGGRRKEVSHWQGVGSNYICRNSNLALLTRHRKKYSNFQEQRGGVAPGMPTQSATTMCVAIIFTNQKKKNQHSRQSCSAWREQRSISALLSNYIINGKLQKNGVALYAPSGSQDEVSASKHGKKKLGSQQSARLASASSGGGVGPGGGT